MVPDVAKKGHSFKGAFAYYLHDKRQGDGPNPTTAERVDWTETRNLISDDPETAKRIMIATALQADQLKAEAGVKTTGRKSTAHVYAYSLAWHPDEAATLDRAEMVKAADSSLIALGADHLQAVIVAHRDQKHPHVHIIVNRVDPETGKMHGFQNDHRQLDAWARAYEEARGRILTPKRGRDREPPPSTPTPTGSGPAPQAAPAVRPPSKGQQLAAASAQMKADHKTQWAALTAAQKARREQAWQERPSFKEIAAQHKTDTRPAWSAFGKQQAAERRAFYAAERTLTGVIGNAIQGAKFDLRGDPSERGLLGKIFVKTLDDQARRASFTAMQAESKTQFSAGMKSQLDMKIEAAKTSHAAKLTEVRSVYDAERAALAARQKDDRAVIREGWRKLYEERGKPARSAWAGRQEKPAMDPRDEWKKAMQRGAPQPAMPTRSISVPAPQPAPSPAGETPTVKQAAATVPEVDKAAEWAKTREGQRVVAQQTQKAGPDSLRSKAPDAYKAAPTPPQPPMPAQPPQPPQPPMPAGVVSVQQEHWSKVADRRRDAPANIQREWNKAPERRSTGERPRDREKDYDHDR